MTPVQSNDAAKLVNDLLRRVSAVPHSFPKPRWLDTAVVAGAWTVFVVVMVVSAGVHI